MNPGKILRIDVAAAAQAAIIIECVPEILELKKSVFEQLGRHCPPEAIYVTNTSSLVPSQLAGSCPHSERMAALHFHLPVALSNVVDLMPHPDTDPAVVAALDAFAREIGQIPTITSRNTTATSSIRSSERCSGKRSTW